MDLRTKFRWGRATPIRIAGALLVAISMFPIAVTSGETSLRGYECAKLFIDVFRPPRLTDVPFSVMLCMSSFINPLLILYLLFKPARRRRLVLTVFGVLLLEGISVLMMFLLIPRAGFFLWVAGIILILAPPYGKPEEMMRDDPGSEPITLHIS